MDYFLINTGIPTITAISYNKENVKALNFIRVNVIFLDSNTCAGPRDYAL